MYTEHPAPLAERLQHGFGYIPPCLVLPAGIGVGDRDRTAREIDRFPCRALTGVRHVMTMPRWFISTITSRPMRVTPVSSISMQPDPSNDWLL